MSQSVLQRATSQDSDDSAVAWIAEGRTLRSSVDVRDLMRALLRQPPSDTLDTAVALVARRLAASDLDSSSYLFDLARVPSPDVIRLLLDRVAARTGGLHAATADDLYNGVRAALSASNGPSVALVYDTLGALIGRSADELLRQCPIVDPRNWKLDGARQLYDYITQVLTGSVAPGPGGGVATTALELLEQSATPGRATSGLEALEALRRGGVPYELLLAQRIAGGSWRTHRDGTSKHLSDAVRAELGHKLDEAGIRYVALGGKLSDADRRIVTRILATEKPDARVAFMALPDGGTPTIIVVAMANDGGSVRKPAAALAKLRVPVGVRAALVTLGLGWAARNETSQVVGTFGENIFTERSLDQLVACIT